MAAATMPPNEAMLTAAAPGVAVAGAEPEAGAELAPVPVLEGLVVRTVLFVKMAVVLTTGGPVMTGTEGAIGVTGGLTTGGLTTGGLTTGGLTTGGLTPGTLGATPLVGPSGTAGVVAGTEASGMLIGTEAVTGGAWIWPSEIWEMT